MKVTMEKAQRIRLLSDGQLYDEAVELAQKHAASKVSKAQLRGLQNAVGTGDWQEITNYIKNRIDRSTTSDELKAVYEDLKKYLNNFIGKKEGVVVENRLVVIPENSTRSETRLKDKEIRSYACLLAKEFIQHLVAEFNYLRQADAVEGTAGQSQETPDDTMTGVV